VAHTGESDPWSWVPRRGRRVLPTTSTRRCCTSWASTNEAERAHTTARPGYGLHGHVNRGRVGLTGETPDESPGVPETLGVPPRTASGGSRESLLNLLFVHDQLETASAIVTRKIVSSMSFRAGGAVMVSLRAQFLLPGLGRTRRNADGGRGSSR